MKNNKFLILAAFLTTLISVTGFQDSPQHKILFEKAKFTMETKGDLNGAIDLFSEIIKKYPKEREYAAKSQLFIGLCYEKLGQEEAQKAYSKVVENYPEQTETVKLASENLGRLLKTVTLAAKEDKEFSIRRVKEGLDIGVFGGISPDGKYILYANNWSLDLVMYDIATGTEHFLVKTDIESDAYTSRWSPDGKQVAYTWYHDNGQIDLRLVGLDGVGPRVLYSNELVSWIEPEDWSPDGKSILAILNRNDKSSQMVLISVGDGSVTALKNFDNLAPGRSRFSPDGRYIAYSLQEKNESGEKDIFVLSVDGEREIQLVQDPADDVVLDWTPDGKGILFSSNRTGSLGAWLIQIMEGKARGTPELVRPDLGADFIPMGFTRNGSFYFGAQKEMKDVYIAEVDLMTGKLISAPALAAQSFAGSNYGPDWSADGENMVYLSQRGSGEGGARTICVRSTETGKISELNPKLNPLFWIRWSPVEQFLLAGAPAAGNGSGIFSIDIKTGVFQQIMTPHIGWPAAWSRDGKAIFTYRSDSTTDRITVIMHDLGTGNEKELYNLPFDSSNYYTSGLALSHNGNQLAFSVFESGSKIIKILPTDGGEIRDLFRINESFKPISFGFGTVAWTSDDQNLLFLRQTNNSDSKRELWMIPARGGEPRKLELMAENMRELSLHPDGRHIAFTSSHTRSEIWVMQNFLPEEKIGENIQLTLKKLDNAQLNSPYAEISPDGKKIAYYIDGKPDPGIGILDLETGSAKMLVEKGGAGLVSKVWSPRSDRLAFRLNGNELHICEINGPKTQLFYKSPEYRLYPTDWSPDEKKILCFFESEDLSMQIGTITFDGQVKFIATGSQTEFSSKPKFSPDGRYVACSLKDEKGNSDIFILSSDGSQKERIASYTGRDENPVWSPDGKYLLFISDRNRSADLWGIQINNGKAIGSPFIIKRDLGWRTLIQDLTADGKLFLFMLGGDEPGNIFTIPLDQMSGTLKSPVVPISVYPTDHSFPRYSPDGKMIAFLSRRGQVGWPKLYVINEEGAERELFLQGHYAVNIAWNTGNQSLFFAGWDKTYKPGIYEVSLETGNIKPVYINEFVDFKTGKGRLININLLPDEGKLILFRFLENENVEVLAYKPGAQQPEVVLPGVKMPVWGLPSPTGENICYPLGDSLMVVSILNGSIKHVGSSTRNLEATWSPNGEKLMFREGSNLRMYSLKENNTRTIYKAPAEKTIGGMEMYANSWSPNGNWFIIAERDTSASSTSPQNLIMINPGNGSVNTLGEVPEGCMLSELRWSPDGNKVIATSNNISKKNTQRYEYWVLENFLPE